MALKQCSLSFWAKHSLVQIASRLVRRVQSDLRVRETVGPDQRLGMMRFGSLVAIMFPDREDVQIEVTPGDYVKAGSSVLARYRVDGVAEN